MKNDFFENLLFVLTICILIGSVLISESIITGILCMFTFYLLGKYFLILDNKMNNLLKNKEDKKNDEKKDMDISIDTGKV